MNEQQAEQHLRERAKLMDGRYVRDYPKWTVADTVALSIMLREVVNVRREAGTQKPEPSTPDPYVTKVTIDYAGVTVSTQERCTCGALLAHAPGIGAYCTAGFYCTAPSPIAPSYFPSAELTALLDDLHRDPRKYRLTNLETGTTWAFTVRDGRVVPEREVCPK